jgi:hypothetical protein
VNASLRNTHSLKLTARPSLAVQLAGDAIAPDTRVTGISHTRTDL